ncbi:vinorine synthase-like [Coffea eugenioides]|uniref:vinorine synthase-like n=1 Tax=Coffea eugenioides TaxID=49369 RepID=UPI000F60A0C5|nr:vinorine synthase-like [Coffea eugenioides]
MNVKILSEEIIKPSSPTPHHHPNTYKVSLLDQFSPSSYMPFILFYKNKNNSLDHQDSAQTLSHLKESFSKTLAIYYPLAGRFRDAATIECNDEGGLYVEAQVNATLPEFLKQPDVQFLNNFLPCKANGLEKDRIPPVAVKITQFQCGGLVVGACLFHKVVDAAASAAFLNSWARVARGEKVVEPDFSSASALFPPKDPLSDDFVRYFDNFFFQGKKSYMRRYVFDATALTTLRANAASEKVPNPSRVEALSAFVAERLTWASTSAKSENFSTLMITHPVNLRQRIEPPLPDNTFGNIIWLAFAFYEIDPSNTEKKIDLADLVKILREAFAGLNKDSIAELDADEAFNALNEVLESVYTNENIKIFRFTSANNMGLYDVDFGWGTPSWVAHMGDMVGYRSKQQFVFLEATTGKGLELWLASDEAELSILEKDPEFLEYATPNPSICIE